MINYVKINFKLTQLRLQDFLKAFNEQKPITVTFFKLDGNNPALDTEPGDIFITKWNWITEEDFEIFFVTLFKSEGMIPGTYKMKLTKRDLKEENQAHGYLLPVAEQPES